MTIEWFCTFIAYLLFFGLGLVTFLAALKRESPLVIETIQPKALVVPRVVNLSAKKPLELALIKLKNPYRKRRVQE